MNLLRALLLAQARSAWNRIRHESEISGPLAGFATLAILALVLAVPGLGTLWWGLHLGRRLSPSPSPEVVLRWNALQALFTVGLAVLGSFRHRPAFTHEQLVRWPIPPLLLFLAEVPAALFEAFPLLGVVGILSSNLALAIRIPAAAPFALLLSLQGILAMTACLFLAASARRLLSRRPIWALAAGLGLLAVLFHLRWEGVRSLVRSHVPALIPRLPGSQGYAGFFELRSGATTTGLARLAVAFLVTFVLVAAAAWIHQRVLALERGTRRSRGSAAIFRFRRPAAGIGRLFLHQLLGSTAGRFRLVLPALFTIPAVIVFAAARFDADRDRFLPEKWFQTLDKIETLPLLPALFFLIVVLDSPIWMNQFGWDRAGVRTLLTLPVAGRDILIGKLLGLGVYVILQALIGGLPLLWIHAPAWPELLAAVGVAGASLVVATGVGHVVSVRFPRHVAQEGAAEIPLHLSWIPTGLMVAVAVVWGGVFGAAGSLETAAVASAVVLGGTLGAYFRALPALAGELRRHREHLLRL